MIKKFAGIPLDNTIIMGILNLSSETFYKKSLVQKPAKAAKKAEKMVRDGAQIIDIGGMSTGPSAKIITPEKEKDLLVPVIKKVKEKIEAPISVDTQRGEIAEIALETGAEIINDISGFKADEKMSEIVSKYNCHAILMANRISGRIRTAEKKGKDISDIKKVKKGLRESLEICKKSGVNTKKIAIDPGIGFGREADEDLRLIADIDKLSEFDKPVCVGFSRKSLIGKTLNIEDPNERLPGSLGATAVAIFKGSADIIRTHDPKETWQMVRIIEAIEKEGGIEWKS